MAKQRNVDYVLRIVTDPKNAATAADFAQHFKDLEASARGAERAAKAASAAVRGAGSGSGARGGRGGAGGFGGGFAAASAREERIERDTNLRQAAAAFEREKRLLADRVRAHLDASRKIREAARAASSAGWQRRQAAANFGAYARDPVAPAENRAMSRPDGPAVSASSTTTSVPFHGRVVPADRDDAK